MVADRDVADFGEPERRTSATRVFEFEARLRVRHTLKLSRGLPLEFPDLSTVLFLLGESGKVLVEPGDGSLQSLRVNFREDGELVFPVGESVVVFVCGTDIVGVYVLVLVQGVVVRLAMNVDVMLQFNRSLLCRVCRVAVTVLHRYLSVRDVLA